MARRARRILLGLATTLGVGFLALWATIHREYGREPMPLLDFATGKLVLREATPRPVQSPAGERRRMVELTFDGVPEGPLRAALSLPEQPPGRLPVVIILGGLEVGRESLRYVENHGPNALVAFEYPRPTQDLYEGRPLFKLGRIRRAALAVPSQICALQAWIRAQPWADPDRISLLGYSFGAMFVPAAARVAQERGLPFRTLVMAYGGADLPGLLAANASFRPAWLRPFAARAVGAILRPLEPSLHLPHLRGEALFLSGLKDERVPLRYSRLMQSLKPPPMTVIDLDEGHMDPGRPDLNRRIVGASQAWLVQRGALSPPDAQAGKGPHD